MAVGVLPFSVGFIYFCNNYLIEVENYLAKCYSEIALSKNKFSLVGKKMKEFFSNPWVISIISGILVFFITSLFIMLYNKFQHKRQIEEANQTVVNHLRSYVVDNGLPEKEIIDAVRLSVAREYNVQDENLLTNKAFCEEL